LNIPEVEGKIPSIESPHVFEDVSPLGPRASRVNVECHIVLALILRCLEYSNLCIFAWETEALI
jgi:hypothetical protein